MADRYIKTAGDGGVDAPAGGTTWGDAWATLEYAIGQLGGTAGTHNVYIRAGNYAPVGPLVLAGAASWVLNWIGCDNAGTPTTNPATGPTYAPSSAARCIFMNAGPARTVTFTGMNIVSNAATQMFDWAGAVNTGDCGLWVTDCTLGFTVVNQRVFGHTSGSDFVGPTRTFKFIRCAIDMNNSTAVVLVMGNSAGVTATDCTLTNSGNCDGFIVPYATTEHGAYDVQRNTGLPQIMRFTGATDFHMPSITVVGNTSACGNKAGIDITGSGITSTPAVTITDNTITATSSGGTDAHGIMVGEPVAAANLGTVIVTGNRVIMQNGGGAPASCHGIGVFKSAPGALVAYNTVLSDGGPGVWSLVAKGDNDYVHHNVAEGVQVMTVADGDNGIYEYNTLYCDRAGGYTMYIREDGVGGDEPGNVRARWNLVHGGAGGAAGNALRVPTPGAVGNALWPNMTIDYNCYVAPAGGNLAHIVGTDCAAIQNLRNAWEGFAGSPPQNDDNSIEAAAASVLFVDQSNGDYRFAPGSAGFRYGRYASGGWPTAMGGGMGT